MTLHYIIRDKNDCIIGGGKEFGARHFCNGADVRLELERENPHLEFLPDSYFEPKI